ncbi:MAG TPA: hypothetical protein PK156_39115 [Polyangium sp.]|nr:hypothetical protein [Polyangium sp.]
MRALVRKAKLSPSELQLFEAESEDITTDMLDRIATVLDMQRIILCMTPEEHAVVARSAAEMQLSNDKPQQLVRKRLAKRPSRAQGAA